MVYHIAGGHQEHGESYTHWFKELDGDPKLVQIEDRSQDNGRLVLANWNTGHAFKPDHMPTRLFRGGPGPTQSPILDVDSFFGGTRSGHSPGASPTGLLPTPPALPVGL